MDDDRRRLAMTGVFIPAGLFIGMGIGLLYDRITAGLFIGLGAGFLLMAVTRLSFKGSARAPAAKKTTSKKR